MTDDEIVMIPLDPDADRPQAAVIVIRADVTVGLSRDTTYVIDADRIVRVGPRAWEVLGPPGVVFREGDAGWHAIAPEGHTVQLVTEDVPGRPGWLRFRQPPCERPS